MKARPRLLTLTLICGAIAASMVGCQCDSAPAGPPVPASSHPEGKDLEEGSIVVATEKTGGVRIYKIKEIQYFPPPMSDEITMIAFAETGHDFKHAAALWHQRDLTVALENVRVPRAQFNKFRDYRVIDKEPVTEQDKKLKREDKLPPR